MKLTDEQRTAVLSDSNISISACPGSGKTRALVSKLIRCALASEGTPFRVACITYTNAGVDEIQDRVASGASGAASACDISTIHTFCLNSILRPFRWLSERYANGFVIVTNESAIYQDIAQRVIARHGPRYPGRALKALASATRAEDGTPLIDGENLSPACASEFWDELGAQGYIDFTTVLYESWRLIRDHSHIAQAIAATYRWILIDETQDTTSIQISILQCIADIGKTKFFLVGDPHQSIFAFAHADYRRVQAFSAQNRCRTDVSFTKNFRSSEKIVTAAESLLARTPPMKAVGIHRKFPMPVVHLKAATSVRGILDSFVPAIEDAKIALGRCVVLASQWSELYAIGTALRNAGLEVIGPGTRPYKGSRVIAPLLEALAACSVDGVQQHFRATMRAARRLADELTDAPAKRIDDFLLATGLHRLIRLVNPDVLGVLGAAQWIPQAAALSTNILQEIGFLSRPEAEAAAISASEMLTDMSGKDNFDVTQFGVQEMASFASAGNSMRLMTIHHAKGREFDAVAIVGAHEGTLPYKYSVTAAQLSEEQRKLYVAITRPKKFLMLITETSPTGAAPSRFLANMNLTRQDLA